MHVMKSFIAVVRAIECRLGGSKSDNDNCQTNDRLSNSLSQVTVGHQSQSESESFIVFCKQCYNQTFRLPQQTSNQHTLLPDLVPGLFRKRSGSKFVWFDVCEATRV